MMRFSSLVIPIVLGLAACTQQAVESPAAAAETAPATHPISGLAVIPVSIESHGITHTFRAEVAATAHQQAQGLMFRTEMGKDEGMIFPRPYAQPASFWMKNTVIPLDIVYIGADHRVLNIADAKPYSLEPIPSDGPALAVLELNGGRAAELGIKAGDLVSW